MHCSKVYATTILVMGFITELFSLHNGILLMIFNKLNPMDQWGKILVTIMGFAHTFGHYSHKRLSR